MFRRHDVVGLAIAFDDPASSKDLDGWRELLETWKEATGELAVPGALLGETFTFLCAYDAPSTDPLRPAVERAMHPVRAPPLEHAVRAAEPASCSGTATRRPAGGWWRRSRRSEAAMSCRGCSGGRASRTWHAWCSTRCMPPRSATRSACTLRARQTSQTAVERVARAVDESLAAHRDLDARSTSTIATAERRLIEAQADSAGLVIQLSYFRALQRTIDIARHNMALVSPRWHRARYPGTMIDRDRALAMRLSDQIEHDIGYAEAVGERAQHATSLSSLRLQQSQERLQAGRSRLVLFQTALLSALLTGIGAIATFDLSLDVARPLRFPLLATLVTVLLAAPIVAASWHDGFRPLDRLVIGLLGGSLAWLGLASALPSAPWFAAQWPPRRRAWGLAAAREPAPASR